MNNRFCKDEKDLIVALSNYDYIDIHTIAERISTLCGIDIIDMLNSRKAQCSQARWLFWYTLKTLNDEPFETIVEKLKCEGNCFSGGAATMYAGTKKMSYLIEHNYIWKKRWNIIHGMIKQMKNDYNETHTPKKEKIVISVSNKVDVEIKKV